MHNLQLPDGARLLPQHCGVHDDFRTFVTGGEFTSLVADSGSSVAAGDTENGVVALTTGATDNNEAALFTTKKIFLVGDDKPHYFETYLKLTEAATNAANIFAGFSSVLGANQMVDTAGGPAASMSGAFFYKLEGTLTWAIGVSIGSTQTLATLTAQNSFNKIAQTTGTAFVKLAIEILPKTSTVADVIFKINDKVVYKITDWTYTSAAAMYAGAYVKAGSGSSEVLNVDYVSAYKVR